MVAVTNLGITTVEGKEIGRFQGSRCWKTCKNCLPEVLKTAKTVMPTKQLLHVK
jgi:hypothetical protein